MKMISIGSSANVSAAMAMALQTMTTAQVADHEAHHPVPMLAPAPVKMVLRWQHVAARIPHVMLRGRTWLGQRTSWISSQRHVRLMMAPLVRLLLSTTMKVMLMLLSTAMKKDMLALLKIAVAISTTRMERWTMTIEEMTGSAPAAHLQRFSFAAVLVLVWITTTQR